jgi:uncharacterized protein with beta-barrel porin domain
VLGNLTLASGANYVVALTPTTATQASATAGASLNGTLTANFASGAYAINTRYSVLTANFNGITGTFASFSAPTAPGYVKPVLSYDAFHVYLTLQPVSLGPLLPGANANQAAVISAIDTAVLAGALPPSGFGSLYNLSGPALAGALDQISGQIGPNIVNGVGQNFLSFLSMTAQGGDGGHGSFAPGSAYGDADAPHRAQLAPGAVRVWGAAYGGHVGLSGDPASGAASLSSSNVGFVGGADLQLDDHLLAGATLGAGSQRFASGNGTGTSDDYMLSLYGRAYIDAAYVTAAFGYGWHQVKTLRVVTVSGTDVLQGRMNADNFGGRAEAGWRVTLDDQYALSPFVAIAAERFSTPAYGEAALSGTSTFALSYAAHAGTLGRSELGARIQRNYQMEDGLLAADVHAAWAHQLDDQPFTQASFQALPGAGFQLAGVRADDDTALLGLNLEVQNSDGLFFGVRGEGQFGARTTILEGMGNLGWRW